VLYRRLSAVPAIAVACAIVAMPVVAPLAAEPQSDLDGFMAKVLARRDENWKKLQQYILDEKEVIEVRGPAQVPVWGQRRTYSWFIKDGIFIRSPLTVDGVTVSESDRRKAEESYLKRMKARDRRAAERAKEGVTDPADAAPTEMPTTLDGLLNQTRQPEFVDSAYFLKFKFEQGKYALVGKEPFNGGDVLKIEYYPARLFSHEQEQQQKRDAQKKKDRGEDVEAQMERMMNKVSLVTIWVEPKTYQIVKYTFDNVNFDFLPAAWLLRLNDLKATMTMSQPFKAERTAAAGREGNPAPPPGAVDLWLPKEVEFYFAAMLAIGSFDVRYKLDYHDYREAATSGRIKK
jgi:hypothetical protein